MNRKIFAWALYDFADLLLIANFTLYFSQWVVVDNHFEDIWYGGAISLATILLILTAPFWGVYSDETGKKVGILYPLTAVLIGATALLGIVGGGNFLATTPRVLIALAIFVVVQYCYQLGLIFFDTLLPVLAKPRSYGWVSGFVEAMGELGYIAGLFLTYPFISGMVTIYGTPGRIQAFIPTAILDLGLSIPMFLLVKDKITKKVKSEVQNFGQVLGRIKDILKNRNLLMFLLSFYFLSDGVLTLETFFPVYFQQVLGFSDAVKITAMTVPFVALIIGSVIFGKVADWFGVLRVYSVIVVGMTVMFALFPLISGIPFWILLVVLGLWWGGLFSVSRVLMVKLSPPEKISEYFSLFTIFRRFASIIGPLLWGVAVLVFARYGVDKYRLAVYPLVAMMVIGLWLLRKVKLDSRGNSRV